MCLFVFLSSQHMDTHTCFVSITTSLQPVTGIGVENTGNTYWMNEVMAGRKELHQGLGELKGGEITCAGGIGKASRKMKHLKKSL